MAREDTVSTTALVGLQGQLDTVRSEIVTTNTNLQSIGRLIQNDGVEDQRRLLEQREQERLLLERKIRTGQEEALQQRVSNSLVPPVVKLERKLNSTFGNISKALLSLFGFFGTKIIQGIELSAKVGIGALKGIGNTLKGFFGLITGTLGTISKGFTSVISGIGGITGKVLGALGKLATSPFKAIADLVKSLIPGLRGGAVAAAGAGVGAGAASRIGFGLLGLGRFVSGAAAVGSVMEGKPFSAAAYTAATLAPNPLTLTLAGGVGLADLFGFNLDKKISEGLTNPGNINFNDLNVFDPNSKISKGLSEGFNSMIQGVQGFFTPQQPPASSTTTPTPTNVTIQPDDSSKIQPSTRQRNVGAISEPKPDVVYLTSGQNQQGGSVSGSPQTLTDVPLIPSANPDNFYTVYAQLNYNVVL